jgi:hypothetical protein
MAKIVEFAVRLQSTVTATSGNNVVSESVHWLIVRYWGADSLQPPDYESIYLDAFARGHLVAQNRGG